MILASVKSAKKNSQLLWLKFLEGRLLPLSIDDFVSLGIKKTQEIDDALFSQMEQRSARFMMLQYSLRQIAISPKIQSILVPKLKLYCRRLSLKFGYQSSLYPAIIDEIIQKLTDDGLLDEPGFVDYYLRRHSKKSVLENNYRLRQLGIKTVIPKIPGSDSENIKKILLRKYSQINLDDFAARQKVIAALTRKGFALNDIKNAIDEMSGKLVEY